MNDSEIHCIHVVEDISPSGARVEEIVHSNAFQTVTVQPLLISVLKKVAAMKLPVPNLVTHSEVVTPYSFWMISRVEILINYHLPLLDPSCAEDIGPDAQEPR